MLTERLGNFGYPFDAGDGNRTLASFGSVLRIARNRLFHGGESEVFDARHAVDTVRSVLAHTADAPRAGHAAGVGMSLIEALVAAETVGPADKQLEESECDESAELSGEVQWEPWTVVIVGEQGALDLIGRTG